MDKKILISLRNGTDLSKQGYWAIEMANTWAIANPRVLHKFKEMKSHILTNVFGEAFWARQSKLRYANRIERKQVGYILGELKDLTTIKKTRRGFTKQEQHFKVGFKATQISPEADSRYQYETKKKKSVRKKIIKKDSWKEGDGTDEHHTEDGHAVSISLEEVLVPCVDVSHVQRLLLSLAIVDCVMNLMMIQYCFGYKLIAPSIL